MGADESNSENEEYYEDEVCFGLETPAKVTEDMMRELPHTLIGAITMENDRSEVGLGTGILISPDLVLTSAHNLYRWRARKMYENFRFYLAQNGPLGKYFQVKSWYYPEEYTQKTLPLYDYALLRLTEKAEVKGFINLKGDL